MRTRRRSGAPLEGSRSPPMPSAKGHPTGVELELHEMRPPMAGLMMMLAAQGQFPLRGQDADPAVLLVDVHASMDGRVLTDVSTDEFRAARPVRTEGPPAGSSSSLEGGDACHTRTSTAIEDQAGQPGHRD
jgi:hypothetical protein